MSKKLHETLSSFCQGTRNVSHKYDIRCAHTAVPADYGGMAYIGGACTDYACSVDGERSLTGYTALTHEIGHNLGMNHDAGRCYGSDVGIMGGYGAGWSSCSVNDLHNFLQWVFLEIDRKLERAQCVFREAEALAELSSSLIGQEYSPDDIYENRYGPNFFLRKFEYNSHCEAYSCVNLTEGSLYGRMFNHGWQDIPGSYCGEGKICFKLTCTTFADARQTPKIIRPGGWGPWGAWQSCSRTCGVGVTYRRRRCNNPSPINHPGCEGGDSNANEAKICNSEPCSDDSPKQADLIKQRASETCLTMLENKVLNSSEYNSTGDRYSHSGNYVCEVRCKEVGDFKSPYFTRFGLMPHGSPCDAKIFGCDDAFLGGTKEFDECGVCGGDRSTCDVIQGTFTGIPGEEMYDKDDVPVIVSHVGSSWVWNTDESKNPLYQKNDLENKGIHYAYSLPKTGECKNNGTYNLKLRTCDCPTGFYGADCDSRCNIYCFNGAALDESTCTCQCKEHQTGSYCKCETGYTGKDCTEKKSE
uniref:Peptidase M12B domain-containing protein n=1 Tax=Magallana gigas TaxID=29159 RepID=A0A8W8IWI5_MAGGI